MRLLTFKRGKDTLCFMFMPRTVAIAVDQIARQTLGKDWNIYAALLSHWGEIVGHEYARVTTPVKITFPLHRASSGRRENGTLCIRLPQGLAMEFSFKTTQIKQRITDYFGYEAIEKILFETQYSVEKPCETAPLPAAEVVA